MGIFKTKQDIIDEIKKRVPRDVSKEEFGLMLGANPESTRQYHSKYVDLFLNRIKLDPIHKASEVLDIPVDDLVLNKQEIVNYQSHNKINNSFNNNSDVFSLALALPEEDKRKLLKVLKTYLEEE